MLINLLINFRLSLQFTQFMIMKGHVITCSHNVKLKRDGVINKRHSSQYAGVGVREKGCVGPTRPLPHTHTYTYLQDPPPPIHIHLPTGPPPPPPPPHTHTHTYTHTHFGKLRNYYCYTHLLNLCLDRMTFSYTVLNVPQMLSIR